VVESSDEEITSVQIAKPEQPEEHLTKEAEVTTKVDVNLNNIEKTEKNVEGESD